MASLIGSSISGAFQGLETPSNIVPQTTPVNALQNANSLLGLELKGVEQDWASNIKNGVADAINGFSSFVTGRPQLQQTPVFQQMGANGAVTGYRDLFGNTYDASQVMADGRGGFALNPYTTNTISPVYGSDNTTIVGFTDSLGRQYNPSQIMQDANGNYIRNEAAYKAGAGDINNPVGVSGFSWKDLTDLGGTVWGIASDIASIYNE